MTELGALATRCVPPYQFDLAASYYGLAQMQQAGGDVRGAEETFRRAIAIFSELTAAAPNIPGYQNSLAACYTDLGILQEGTRDLSSAIGSARRANQIRNKLLAARPNDPQRQFETIVSYNNLAGLQQSTHDLAGAEDTLDHAIEIGTKLITPSPNTLDFRNERGRSRGMMAWLHHLHGRHREAEQEFLRALEDQRSLCKQAPRSIRYRQTLSIHLANFSRALRSVSRPDEAVRLIRERRGLWERNFGGLYDVACDLALCLPLIPDPARKQALASEAVEVLRSAIAAGWTNAAHQPRSRLRGGFRDRADFPPFGQ